jgi:hypothetical protein
MITALAAAAAMLNASVTPETIHQTVCVSGYTATIRPPGSYTARIKRQLLHGRPAKAWTLDHTIPLEIGGAPGWPNLQLQTKADAKAKDRLEDQLRAAVCAGRVGLREAQERMESWRP